MENPVKKYIYITEYAAREQIYLGEFDSDPLMDVSELHSTVQLLKNYRIVLLGSDAL